MKTEKCEQLGYRLIHIFENEWNNNKDEIKFRLKQIFENKEIISNNDKILDRCWFSTLQNYNKQYELLPAKVIEVETKYNKLHYENCGYIKFL